jgi:outer membrane protein assembly factor BamD
MYYLKCYRNENKELIALIKHIFLAVLVVVTVSGCTVTQKKEPISNIEDLYNAGINKIKAGRYQEGIDAFENLEKQHPYSQWSTRGQTMVAYAHFKMGNYDESILSAERFIRLHPGHKNLDYLYYLRALSFYHRISDITRDQGYTLEALEAFREITYRFPESKYARDAKLKITLCEGHLAGQELMVGRYYQEQGRFLAAINRFRNVVASYEKSNQTPEALFRIAESYLALGIEDEAQAAAAVLGYNFPTSDWYKDAYAMLKRKNLEPQESEDTPSWLSDVVQGVRKSIE